MVINEEHIENEALRLIPLSVIVKNFNISQGLKSKNKIRNGIDALCYNHGLTFSQAIVKLKEISPNTCQRNILNLQSKIA